MQQTGSNGRNFSLQRPGSIIPPPLPPPPVIVDATRRGMTNLGPVSGIGYFSTTNVSNPFQPHFQSRAYNANEAPVAQPQITVGNFASRIPPPPPPPLPPVPHNSRYGNIHRQSLPTTMLSIPPPPPPLPPQNQSFSIPYHPPMQMLPPGIVNSSHIPPPPQQWQPQPYRAVTCIPPPPTSYPKEANNSISPQLLNMKLTSGNPFSNAVPLPASVAMTTVAVPPIVSRLDRRNSAPIFSSSTNSTTSILQHTPLPTKPEVSIPKPFSYTNEEIEKSWTEFKPTDGGNVYYYNSLTGKTQWEIPNILKQNQTSTPSTVTNTWKEYTDISSGKKYYSNGVSTTWTIPENFEQTSKADSVTMPPQKKKMKLDLDTKIVYATKNEAAAAFKIMLLETEITPTMKWNDVVKLCSSDARWNGCSELLSVGERKQSMAEFQSKRANELKDFDRKEKVRIKESFLQLLADVLPSLPSFSAWTSRFDMIRDKLSHDDRFYAIDSESTRESLFLDFCEEYKKREERKKQNAKREAKASFVAFLKEKQQDGKLSYISTWASFVAILSTDDMLDSRFATSAILSDPDRQLHFADFMGELKAAEDDKRRHEHLKSIQLKTAARDEYLSSLRDLAVKGKIMPSSNWRSISDLVKNLRSYRPVCEQDQELPRDLFEDFVRTWNDTYRVDRSILSEIVFSKFNKQNALTEETKYEDFVGMLLNACEASPDLLQQIKRIINTSDPMSSARLYLQELDVHLIGTKGSTMSNSIRRNVQYSDLASSESEGEIVEDQ